jgi:hypothetical protein
MRDGDPLKSGRLRLATCLRKRPAVGFRDGAPCWAAEDRWNWLIEVGCTSAEAVLVLNRARDLAAGVRRIRGLATLVRRGRMRSVNLAVLAWTVAAFSPAG